MKQRTIELKSHRRWCHRDQSEKSGRISPFKAELPPSDGENFQKNSFFKFLTSFSSTLLLSEEVEIGNVCTRMESTVSNKEIEICGKHSELCRKLKQKVRKKLIQFSLSLVEKNKEKENREAVCKTDRTSVKCREQNF